MFKIQLLIEVTVLFFKEPFLYLLFLKVQMYDEKFRV